MVDWALLMGVIGGCMLGSGLGIIIIGWQVERSMSRDRKLNHPVHRPTKEAVDPNSCTPRPFRPHHGEK